MKPTPTSPTELAPLLAFGAHPDDIEFGCGGVVALETRAGRPAHLIVCSRGESATHGTPAQRTQEAEKSASLLGAKLEFLELNGDAHLECSVANVIKLAAALRRVRPAIVLAPTTAENQHPDHAKLGHLVRDAARLARFGGLEELRSLPPHSIENLFHYALTPDAEPSGATPFLIDVSPPEILTAWTAAMEAHASQSATRQYVEFQLTRARLNGLRAGVDHAVALFPNDPPVIKSLTQLGHGARRF
jgi:LmbE family N-acetylglucosaminyl deacetylase